MVVATKEYHGYHWLPFSRSCGFSPTPKTKVEFYGERRRINPLTILAILFTGLIVRLIGMEYSNTGLENKLVLN